MSTWGRVFCCRGARSPMARVTGTAFGVVAAMLLLSFGITTAAGAQATTTVTGVVTWDPGPTGDYYVEVCWRQHHEIEPGLLTPVFGCVQPDALGNYSLTFDSAYSTTVNADIYRVDGEIFPREYVVDIPYISVPTNTSTPVSQDFHLIVKPMISGTATFADGSPASGATVCAINAQGVTAACAVTDENGNYALVVQFGSDYRVKIRSGADAFYAEYFDDVPVPGDNSIPAGITLITFDGAQRQTADFVVEPTHRVTGTVRFSSGAVASDARVCAVSVVNRLSQRCAQVDPITGIYSISLLSPDDVFVQVSSPGGQFVFENYADIYSFSAEPPDEATVVGFGTGTTQTANMVVDPYASISGSVTDAVFGQLSEEVLVCFHQQISPSVPSADNTEVSCVFTQNGEYSYNVLVPGTVTVTFGEHSTMYEAEAWNDQSTTAGEPITIGVGGVLTGYDAALTPKYTVTAAVEDAAGEPVDGIEVCALLQDGEEVCAISDGGAVDLVVPYGMFTLRFTDPDGRYVTEYWGDTTDQASATQISAADWQASAPLTAVLVPTATATTTAPTTTAPTTTTPGEQMSTTSTTAAASAGTSRTTTAAAQVLGANQAAATPSSRTGSAFTGWMVLVATAAIAAGFTVLASRRTRQ